MTSKCQAENRISVKSFKNEHTETLNMLTHGHIPQNQEIEGVLKIHRQTPDDRGTKSRAPVTKSDTERNVGHGSHHALGAMMVNG